MKKYCFNCNEPKDVRLFATDNLSANGLNSRCRACTSAYSAHYRAMVARQNAGTVAKKKQCGRCAIVKPSREFHRCSGDWSGLQTYCKMCMREYIQRWSEKKREKVVSQTD